MTVLITGATGFIGSRLALSLLAKGQSVRVLTLVRGPAEQENCELLERRGAEVMVGSLTDRDAVEQAVEGAGKVFHLAAAQHEANVPDQHFWDVNVTGTSNLVDAASRGGVRRFVHGSTIGVYGGTPHRTVTESSPTEPTNIYGSTKLAAENEVRQRAGAMEWVIVRISETYGPGDNRLLKLFRGVKQGRFFFVGGGANLHHLIYIDDLLKGLEIAAEDQRAAGQTFVLAGPRPVPTREMVSAAAAATEARVPPWRLPKLPMQATAFAMEKTLSPLGIQPPLHRRRLNFFLLSFDFSDGRARELLDFHPEIDFDEGANSTAQWYAEQGLLDA